MQSSTDLKLSIKDRITEPEAIALLEQMRREPIVTSLCSEAIATNLVQLGNGDPPILLLHGFDSSLLEFRRLMPLLAAYFNTWAIDLWGFGFTERRPDLDIHTTALRTHLHYAWKTLIGQPVVLVGVSMGGAAAIDFALRYPEAVQRLVLIDSAGYRSGPAFAKLLPMAIARQGARFLARPTVRQDVTRRAFYNSQLATDSAYACGALHLAEPHWETALAQFTRSGGYGSFRSQLSTLRPPTLILWGDTDRILGTRDALRLARRIPQSQLIWISQCGHLPHLEKPQEVATAICQFCQPNAQ
ncbi:alpha/beta fold hydrolase [Leptolyngbya sp. O-77]|uniref:alpha/beta fold hydrolase n=1 Tax=Leptolyngbya sp. O-77 TaxID=1080068 RepID=UPI00074D4928|nr:alpha/beta hydrolase [Leptolyngbya sp. O-77]BAU44969.1 Lipase 1 precursor [Leptolyngbya sp. O-77]